MSTPASAYVIGSVIALSCRRPWASQKPLKNRLIRLKSQTETESTVPRDAVELQKNLYPRTIEKPVPPAGRERSVLSPP
jgi:hypothetical protein